ncbi:hypothetical protein NQD34_013615 [Periophthalmus magnuspinnatus]|nr:hypothetical protein NQD34_013615 [Periophthalmus magnuspinnatus]
MELQNKILNKILNKIQNEIQEKCKNKEYDMCKLSIITILYYTILYYTILYYTIIWKDGWNWHKPEEKANQRQNVSNKLCLIQRRKMISPFHHCNSGSARNTGTAGSSRDRGSSSGRGAASARAPAPISPISRGNRAIIPDENYTN